MKIEYKIEESDFLTHQLFVASKSERIKKKRRRSKFLVPLLYFFLGILLLSINDYSTAIAFFSFGILWFFIYPIWEKKYYIKHYKGFIIENYKERFGRVATLEINNEFIFTKGDGIESKVLTSEIEEICEIPDAIYIRLKNGQSFILPKEKILNFDDVKTRLTDLAIYLKIKFDTDKNWKWK